VGFLYTVTFSLVIAAQDRQERLEGRRASILCYFFSQASGTFGMSTLIFLAYSVYKCGATVNSSKVNSSKVNSSKG
jgi:hypothetical protein